MTSPGGDIPEGAYVGNAGQSNSIARLSDISEESAKAMMQGATAPSFNRQRDAAWGVFNDIAYAITGVQVDENGNPIQHIEDWATKDLHNLGTVIEDYGSTLEELGQNRVVPWAVPTVAPLSQSINRRADPTFQLSDLMSPTANVALSGRTERGGSDPHSHALGSNASTTTTWSMPAGCNVKGRIYYAFITPAVTRAYTQLNFMVSAVTDPCRMDIAVYLVDQDRGLTRQVHQTDALASLGIGESVVAVNFETFVAEQGSYLAVAFLQHGTGNSRYILGLDDTPRPLLGSIFPPKISATNQVTGRTSLPDTIDGNLVQQVDFAGYWFTPYAELSEDVGIDYKMFTENWPDIGGQIGRPWVALTSRGIGSYGGYTAAGGSGVRVSMYDQPLSTDRVRIRTSVHRVYGSSEPSTIIVRAASDMRSGLGLQVIPHHDGHSVGRYELISWSGQNPNRDWLTGVTVLHTVNVRPAAGHQLEIDYLDGLVTVRINGTEVVTDRSVSGQSGAARRFVGLQLERTTVFLSGFPSPQLGPWSARDLPEDSGGGDDDEEGEGPIVGE